MDKYMTQIIKCELSSGTYPVFYNGIQVGMATIEGDNVLMTIENNGGEDEDRHKVLQELAAKLKNRTVSMSSVGSVDFSVLKGHNFDVVADMKQLVINDLPEHIASESTPPPAAE